VNRPQVLNGAVDFHQQEPVSANRILRSAGNLAISSYDGNITNFT